MDLSKRSKIIVSTGLLGSLMVLFVYQNCGNIPFSPANNPRAQARFMTTPKVGETIILAPTKTESQTVTSLPQEPDSIYLMVLSDTKPLSYESPATLLMYATAGDIEPLYSFKPSELKTMAATTNCSPTVAQYVKGATVGEALFCNKSLNLNKVHYFVLKESDTDKDTATSYNIDFNDKKNGVLAITLGFN